MKLFSRFWKSKKQECEMINLLDIDGITFTNYFKVKQSNIITSRTKASVYIVNEAMIK